MLLLVSSMLFHRSNGTGIGDTFETPIDTAILLCPKCRKRFCGLDLWTCDLENPVSSWPDCAKYFYKFLLKSLQWFRSWRVHNISLADLDLWPSDLFIVIIIMWAWYWLTVICFIKIPQLIHEIQRWKTDSKTHYIHAQTDARPDSWLTNAFGSCRRRRHALQKPTVVFVTGCNKYSFVRKCKLSHNRDGCLLRTFQTLRRRRPLQHR